MNLKNGVKAVSSVSSSKSFTADMMIQQREMRIDMQRDLWPEQIIIIYSYCLI